MIRIHDERAIPITLAPLLPLNCGTLVYSLKSARVVKIGKHVRLKSGTKTRSNRASGTKYGFLPSQGAVNSQAMKRRGGAGRFNSSGIHHMGT
jgi:hypothetical protein